MLDSEAPRLRQGASLARIIVSWICSAQLITPSLSAGDATFLSIYSVSHTIVKPSLYIWPVQITQSSRGDCPANTVDCLMLQILSTKTYNPWFLANPTDKYACQCRKAPRLWLGAPLQCPAYLSVGFARYCQLYCLCDRICNVCAILWKYGDKARNAPIIDSD